MVTIHLFPKIVIFPFLFHNNSIKYTLSPFGEISKCNHLDRDTFPLLSGEYQTSLPTGLTLPNLPRVAYALAVAHGGRHAGRSPKYGRGGLVKGEQLRLTNFEFLLFYAKITSVICKQSKKILLNKKATGSPR